MAQPKTDIWQFEASLSRSLMQWASFNIGAGSSMTARKDHFWRGLGAQCAGWGLVNAALAWFGLHRGRQKSAEEDAHTPARQDEERQTFARILWINTGLDILYVTGGVALSRTKGKDNRFWRGTGVGITLQGLFLFFFDLFHAMQLTELEN